MKRVSAEIIEEFGPFPDVEKVHGVTCDGEHLWIAAGDRLQALDPQSGAPVRSIPVEAHAGTAFDGTHLYQVSGTEILKVDPADGAILGRFPTPGEGGAAGLAWADGALWVGQYRNRRIHQVDPASGAVLRSIETKRFVTGVTWVDGQLWHGTWEGDESGLSRIDPASGEEMEAIDMPTGTGVSGLEAEANRFFCGGGSSGTVRVVRRARG